MCNDSDFQYSEHGDISLSHFYYVLQQSKQFMKFLWNCLQITVKTQQPWLNLFIIVQTKDCNEYAILTNLFGASTKSSIPKNKNNKNKLHTNSTWFFSLAKQTLYNTEIQILLFVSRFFLLSAQLVDEQSCSWIGLSIEWKYLANKHMRTVNVNMTNYKFLYSFVYVSARRHFLLLQLTS